ncbi:MAG: hypothetical protein U5S82_12095 [Gammaproteobacteria bacterium]|nr:hypothetical protein [Gammaproteobacteria bacterium]
METIIATKAARQFSDLLNRIAYSPTEDAHHQSSTLALKVWFQRPAPSPGTVMRM